jgi:hypothetical protein
MIALFTAPKSVHERDRESLLQAQDLTTQIFNERLSEYILDWRFNPFRPGV